MTDTPTTRRLAAVLAADIAGYSALVSADEEGTVRALKGHQAAVLPLVGQYGGRVIDTAGDGIMAEFGSVIGALKAALAIQAAMAERNADVPATKRLQYRIGINLGDVIFDETRIYGDGINVAARLEGLAEPGGVCVSDKVHAESLGKVECAFEDVGEQALKNIARPVRVYRVRSKMAASPQADPSMLTLPDKPSIAVLPFTNMSGDPEQEYFSDGIAEDILTELSRLRWLFVTARNSSFTYKGKAVDVKQVSRELGVRYVLEGSVRKAGNRVRVTGQLIDATTGNHVWAERFDRDLADIFSVQDEITEAVATAIGPAIQDAERQRAARKATEHLGAWEAYHRGMWHMFEHTANEMLVARTFFEKAISFDPEFSQAYSALTANHVISAAMFDLDTLSEACARAEPLARNAVRLDERDVDALARLAQIAFLKGNPIAAIDATNAALRLNSNCADALSIRGASRIYAGQRKEGRADLDRYFLLSPYDAFRPVRLAHYAISLYLDHDYEGAVVKIGELIRQFPENRLGNLVLGASLGQLGRRNEARAALSALEAVQPKWLQRYSSSRRPFVNAADHAHVLEGLRKAGWNGTTLE